MTVIKPKFLGKSKTPRMDVARLLVKSYSYPEHVALYLVTDLYGSFIQNGVRLDSSATYVAGEIMQMQLDKRVDG